MNIAKKTAFFMVVVLVLVGCASLELPPRDQVIELLQTNGGCELPCFWGIKVGETKWEGAKLWLSKLTKIYDDESFYSDGDGGYPAYNMTFILRDETPTRYEVPPQSFVVVSTIGEDRIQRLVFSPVGSIGDVEFLPEYIQNYSLEKIFKQLGKPDSVFIYICEKYKDPCFIMVVLYDKQKIAIDITGEDLPDNKVCPKIGEGGNLTAMNISIANPDSDLDLIPPSLVINPFLDDWKLVKDVLGIDENEFFRRVLAESPACFDLIIQE
jgi:hypothetical protein